MEAFLWNFEDKCKLTTQKAILLLVITTVAVVGVCFATVLKQRTRCKKIVDDKWEENRLQPTKSVQPGCNWAMIQRLLMGSLSWSRPTRWGEETRPPSFLVGLEGSHNSASPVWQRPILMGEKCELPRFSGLILYDERGQLLDHSVKEIYHQENTQQQATEKPAAAVRITLRDLL